MITQPPVAKDEHFSFTRPQLPARPFRDGAELEAARDTLLPAAQAYTATEEILQRATAEADRLGKDGHLTAQGRRAAFTALSLKELPTLKAHLTKLDAAGAVVQAEAAEVQKVAAVPEPTDSDERLAESFGRRTEKQRLQLLEGAMTGKDPKLLKALASAHPILHGLGEPTVASLRGMVEGAQLDPEAVERVRSKADKVGTVRRALTSTIDAMENASDRARLREANVATLRRGDLATDEQRSKFIDTHGLPAFKALPA